MKKILLLCIGVIMGIVAYAEVQKVAILEVVDKEGKLSYTQKLMLRSNLSRAVTNTEGYEAYDRSDIDAIFSEHDFQRTGNVSNSQIKQLGQMTGATYILLAEGVLTGENKVFVTAKIMNVETAKVEITDNVLLNNSSSSMQRGCRQLANNMFGALAGTSTSTNKFLSMFTQKKEKNPQDSIIAAQKAERAAKEAELKEQQRVAEEQARQERAASVVKAREERVAAEAKARQEREAEIARVREEKRFEKERKAAELAERKKYYIKKLDSKNYEHMGNLLDQKAYEEFLMNNCNRAYLQYKKGKKLIGAGWGLFATGLALGAGGTACMLLGHPSKTKVDYRLEYDPDYDKYYDRPYRSKSKADILWIAGVSAVAAGGTMTLISIPVLGAGYSKRNNAYKVYNKECSSPLKQALSLNITAGVGTLGLALQF